jgi:D-alanyl-D-alanine dipeptidase
MIIKLHCGKAIDFNYAKVTSDFITELKTQQKVCKIQTTSHLLVHNAYYQRSFPGTFPEVFTREAVLIRLEKICEALAPKYGLYIFDAFRTKQTQAYLFETYKHQIHAKKSYLKSDELEVEVRKYVSHPDEPARFAVAPHNSGGAIDLAIYDRSTKTILDFGCSFDETEEIARTDFFEQAYHPAVIEMSEERYNLVRNNRRILFNIMKDYGFTNYQTEWWHYDLGDCMWAIEHNTIHLFDSMEQAVKEKMMVINSCN